MKRIAIIIVLSATAAIGGGQVGGGLWIHAKAAIAQVLLQRAWEKTLAGEKNVRPWPWADTRPVGRLRMPASGTDLIVLAGASGRTLAFGPGWHQGSAEPGQPGNSVLTAHRDTHFKFLRDVNAGDQILLETPSGGSKTYYVTGTAIVDNRQAHLALSTDIYRLTLVTCFPFESPIPGGPLRYLVFAEDTTSPRQDEAAGKEPF